MVETANKWSLELDSLISRLLLDPTPTEVNNDSDVANMVKIKKEAEDLRKRNRELETALADLNKKVGTY